MYASFRLLPIVGLALLAHDAHAGRPQHTIDDSFSPGHARRDRIESATFWIDGSSIYGVDPEDEMFFSVVSGGDVTTVTATLTSDRGAEDLVLVEGDTRLHGGAVLDALPTATAALELEVYDAAGASLATFSGTLAPDGTVSLEADAPEIVCDRRGCTELVPTDVELASAELYDADAGYALALDLRGADTFDVASAALRVTPPCDLVADRGICLFAETDVQWDAVAIAWEAEVTVAHAGVVDVRVQTRDASGAVVANTRTALGVPWDDGGVGAPVLAFDGDALTTVGLIRGREGARVHRARSLAVLSDGWSPDEALPTTAEVEIDGQIVTIPADSYQRRAPERYMTLATGVWIWEARLVVDGTSVTFSGGDLALQGLSAPLCNESTCVGFRPAGDGVWQVSTTQYRWDTAFPTDAAEVSLTLLDERGTTVLAERFTAVFGAELSVAFSTELGFVGDPVDAALAGRVDLLDASGRSVTNGRFYGTLGVDGAGELVVGGVGVDDVAAADTSFAVLLQGEPSACGDDDGFVAVPPLLAVTGNGSGTKNATTTTSARPELL